MAQMRVESGCLLRNPGCLSKMLIKYITDMMTFFFAVIVTEWFKKFSK